MMKPTLPPFKTALRILQLCLIPLLLTNCTTMSPAPEAPQNQKLSIEQRQARLLPLKHWRLTGAIAVKDGKHAWSANLYWQQKGENYTLQLFGPIGGGTIKIVGTPSKVKIMDGSQKVTTSNNPDRLFFEQTGWHLPIQQLIFWIKAMPAPMTTAAKKYDRFNHLQELVQENWHIMYEQYTTKGMIDLPSKLKMQRGSVHIKIVVNNWQLS